jgi:homotetrameric cytidine deaminase
MSKVKEKTAPARPVKKAVKKTAGKASKKIDWPSLRAAAIEIMGKAYAPYSQYPVGAAGLVDDGRIVVGCNVENAAYGVVLCAECGMVSQLHATGGGRFVAMACVDAAGEPLLPCGRCRQLLWENGGPDMLIDFKDGPLSMAELLPHGFGRSDLESVATLESAGPALVADPGQGRQREASAGAAPAGVGAKGRARKVASGKVAGR